MKDGFLKVRAASPALRVADCIYNKEQIIDAMEDASASGVRLLCLPELCITGYTCGDLFLQQRLQRSAEEALADILQASTACDMVVLVGLPLAFQGKLYNCAAIMHRGRLLGLVPKTYIPNYGEFYEKRHFQEGPSEPREIDCAGQRTWFGSQLLFCCRSMPSFVLGVEICEDLWAPVPPSCALALSGATVIANLSASDETIGKAEYRRSLICGQSARLLCGYIYSDAGHDESSTDMVFAGHDLIAENGSLLSESEPFCYAFCDTELDLDRMVGERIRNTSFQPADEGFMRIGFDMELSETVLTRYISPSPFVPADDADRDKRCELILRIQAEGLARRLRHIGSSCAVIGISGGLDSCLALLVAVKACELLKLPASSIHAITMPCFGTGKRTRSNAEKLCDALGVTFKEINITDTVLSHFSDIGQDPENYDVTFENGQARVRTLELMDYANMHGGIVIGTGDLSELALGWATYNGDHMSMYGVNAGVPKTLVRHIVHYAADTAGPGELRDVLLDILDTPVSPELLPASEDGSMSQPTEQLVGPYELHDFYLYHVLRFGFGPAKIYRLARAAFAGSYDDKTLLYWLRSFYRRFFTQQFKRSCMPDGPKVGSVTLSPRGDWRMPSDASNAVWMKELDELE